MDSSLDVASWQPCCSLLSLSTAASASAWTPDPDAVGVDWERLTPRTAAAHAALRPQVLLRLSDGLLADQKKDSLRTTLSLSQLEEIARNICDRFGAPRLSDEELFLSVVSRHPGACNELDRAALADFIGVLFAECAGVAGLAVGSNSSSKSLTSLSCTRITDPFFFSQESNSSSGSPRTPPSRASNGNFSENDRCVSPPMPPPSPADALRVTLRTLAGDLCQVVVNSDASTEDLLDAVERSPIGLANPGQRRLAVGGCVLSSGLRLDYQGVSPGSCIDVVRASPPPKLVKLFCNGFGCGPSIRGSCGTFRRVPPARTKNNRPIYVRDPALSQWNHAMKYHGEGSRYLLYEEHVDFGGRWALVDGREWAGYADNAYAFIVGDWPHPGYLEDRTSWRVYRDARYQREWIEHDSLQLTALSPSDCEDLTRL